MADTFTLTGDLANMIGGDFLARTLSARIESNAAGGVIAEPDAGKVHLGGLKLDVAPDGTFTLAGLLAEGDLQYQVTAKYVDPGTGGPKTLAMGWWPHPLADAIVDLSTLVTTSAAPPAYDIPAALAETLAARDEAEAAAASVQRDQPNGVAPLDGAGLLPDANVPTRLTAAQLGIVYAPRETFDVQPPGGIVTSGDVVVVGKRNAVATDLGMAGVLGGGKLNYENVIGAATTANVNTSTSNLPTADGTGANFSFIPCGYDNVNNGSACIVSGYHNKVESGSTHVTVAGGSIHAVPTGVDYSTIGGGNQNTVTGDHATVGGGALNEAATRATVAGGFTNKATGDNSTVAGGNNNDATAIGAAVGGGTNCDATNSYASVSGGQNNLASGVSSHIGGGSSNTASGQNASVNGGTGSTASATSSTVVGGQTNQAQGIGSTVLGGRDSTAVANYSSTIGQDANAAFVGANVQAASKFSTQGDAQVVRAISRREITGSTLTEVFLAGGATRMVLADDTTWHFDVMVVARRTDADDESAAYRVTGCIDRGVGAASTALVGTPTVTVVAEDSAAWDFQVDADTTNGSLRLRAVGEAGKTIRWVARTELVCVTG